jgi:PPM family protein phosphatase
LKFKSILSVNIAGCQKMNEIDYDDFTLPLKKGNNEDSVLTGVQEDIHYFGIADGVGGCVGGNIASKIATMQAEAVIRESPNEEMLSIFQSVHHKLTEVAAKNPYLGNMATTLTLSIIKGDKAFIGHVGDSRLYLFRNNDIFFKTNDQTMFNSLIGEKDAHNISALKKLYSNILMSVLSPTHDYTLDTATLSLLPGDRILMCSDGVYKRLSDRELTELSMCCDTIQSLALKIKAVLRIRGLVDDSSLICMCII